MTANAIVLVAYLHHRGFLDSLANEDGELMMNRFQLSDMTRLPPSIVLSDDPEEIEGPIYGFYEAGRNIRTEGLTIESESDLFPSTRREVGDCAPLKKALGKSLARFVR